MNEFFARWETESPAFFKRLGKFGKWLLLSGGAIAASTLAAPSDIGEDVIKIVRIASSYMVFGGGIIMAISGLTVDNQDEMKKKLDKVEEPNP